MSQALVAPQTAQVRSAAAFGRVALLLTSMFAISIALFSLAASLSGNYTTAPSHPDYLLSDSFSSFSAAKPDGIGGSQNRLEETVTKRNERNQLKLPIEQILQHYDGMGVTVETGAIGQTKLRNNEPVVHIKRVQANAPVSKRSNASRISCFCSSVNSNLPPFCWRRAWGRRYA